MFSQYLSSLSKVNLRLAFPSLRAQKWTLNILLSNLSGKQVPLLHPWLKHRFLQRETTLQPKAGAGKEAHGCLEGCLIAWPHPGLRDASASLPSCTESLRKHASSNLQKDNCPENKFSFGVRDFLQCNFKGKLKFYTLTTSNGISQTQKVELCGIHNTTTHLSFYSPLHGTATKKAVWGLC